MTKVYIVTSGEYSDYQIEKVFSTLEKAEKYCAVKNTINRDEFYGCYYPLYVEEYDLDTCEVSDNINTFYEYRFSSKRQIDVEPIIVSKEPVATVIDLPYYRECVCVTLKERNYKKAKKIQQDYLAKKKAEQNGL